MTQPIVWPSETRRSSRIWRGSVGSWQLGSLIGEGEWTRVYAARPVNGPDDRPWDFAIKMLKHEDPTAIALLQREAFVGRGVTHPNLISVFAGQVERPPRFVVTPRMESVTLRSILEAWTVPVSHALWIVRQAAEALGALHAAGWRHGDVKPENVLVSPSGHVTVIDLGFCQRLDPLRCGTPDRFAGTLEYAAPELFVATSVVDAAADIYSLGIVLFELLAGEPPFAHCAPEMLAAAHLTATVPHARQTRPYLPLQLDGLIQKVLSKQPLRRPSLEDLIAQLLTLEIETLGIDDGRPMRAARAGGTSLTGE